MAFRLMCRICERSIAANPLTDALRFHKISDEKWRQIFGNLPNLDGVCPGTGSAGMWTSEARG